MIQLVSARARFLDPVSFIILMMIYSNGWAIGENKYVTYPQSSQSPHCLAARASPGYGALDWFEPSLDPHTEN